MAGQIRVTTIIEITDPRGNTGAPLRIPKTITNLTEVSQRDWLIAASATEILWDPTNTTGDTMQDFDVLIFSSDGNLDIEIVSDIGGDIGTAQANTFSLVEGAVFFLASNRSYTNVTGADAFGTGTVDVSDRIRVKNPDATTKNLKVIRATTT